MKYNHNIFLKIKEKRLQGAPIYETSVFFIRGILHGAINTRAASIAFHFFMAMLPALIFFYNLASHLPLEGLQDASKSIMENLLPEKTNFSIQEMLTGYLKDAGKIQVLGIFIAFMFAMNGVNGVISSFNSSYHSIETRSWLQKRKISIILVGIVFTLSVMATCLIVYSNIFMQYLISENIIDKTFTILLLKTGKWIIIYLLILFTISFTYYLAPADKSHWRLISHGSLLASVLTVIACLLFNAFMNKFGNFNLIFGPPGTIMVLMLWFYFNALALLLGFELNASIYTVSNSK